ncbi:MAG: hypothetical protein IIA35_05395 [Proteobacteria bacterium]|nr:hypothetical protein [Pseudomonadota bacterium]
MFNIKRLGVADARKLIKGAKRKAKRIGVPMEQDMERAETAVKDFLKG